MIGCSCPNNPPNDHVHMMVIGSWGPSSDVMLISFLNYISRLYKGLGPSVLKHIRSYKRAGAQRRDNEA